MVHFDNSLGSGAMFLFGKLHLSVSQKHTSTETDYDPLAPAIDSEIIGMMWVQLNDASPVLVFVSIKWRRWREKSH